MNLQHCNACRPIFSNYTNAMSFLRKISNAYSIYANFIKVIYNISES